MIRKSLLASLIAIALLAGPLAAACAGCCPQLQEERSTVVTAGCCDCGQTLERPAVPDASLSGRTAAPEPAAVVLTLPSSLFDAAGGALVSRPACALAFSPPSSPTPRRL